MEYQLRYELLDVQAVFGKGRGDRDQIANIGWIIKKAREFQKNIIRSRLKVIANKHKYILGKKELPRF